MDKKLNLICLFSLFFIIMCCVILYYYKSTKYNNSELYGNIDETVINIDINNSPTKIKITKNTNIDDAPFICFVSDTIQINKFKTFFNNFYLDNKVTSISEFNPIYNIKLYGDSNIFISISEDKIIKIEKTATSSIEYYRINDTLLNNILELIDIKYYLHINSLELPSSSDCLNAKEKLLNETSMDDTFIKKEIRGIHGGLEHTLSDYVTYLKNANDSYWNHETIKQTPYAYNDKNVIPRSFFDYKEYLKEINKNNNNNLLKKIIEDIIYRFEIAIDNHDVSECFEAHKLLHDLDYWCLNYPLDSFDTNPVDCGGISCYYGLIENYNFNN